MTLLEPQATGAAQRMPAAKDTGLTVLMFKQIKKLHTSGAHQLWGIDGILPGWLRAAWKIEALLGLRRIEGTLATRHECDSKKCER